MPGRSRNRCNDRHGISLLSGRQPSLEKVWTIAKAVKCRDKMQNQNHQKDSEDILYLVNPGKMEKRNFKDSAGCISWNMRTSIRREVR